MNAAHSASDIAAQCNSISSGRSCDSGSGSGSNGGIPGFHQLLGYAVGAGSDVVMAGPFCRSGAPGDAHRASAKIEPP